tara:strand:- start:223 stop:1170 length:948 start_codon:yes stop_codon:yes gene_type:complete
MLSKKHLLGLDGYPKRDIERIIKTGFKFREVLDRPIKKVPSLQGLTIANLFFENSTRTRMSFELAQRRLSADSINFSAPSSSLKKGESLKDTIQNIEAMKIDAIVMRHPHAGSPKLLTNFVNAIIINAGDGTHEHPTQAILDLMSLYEKFGKIKGLNIGIIGDVTHSRVARSNIFGLITMGAKVTICGPPNLVPKFTDGLNIKVNHSVDDVIDWANAIIVLRIQKERMGQSLIPSIREYRSMFGITKERLRIHKKEIVIMHPGPINRGIEIDSIVADSDQAIILDQVLNGVASRMAILFLLCGKKQSIDLESDES